MICGAKRFQANIEVNGENKVTSVVARTPAEARKSIRKHFGQHTNIIAVKEK